MITFILLRDYRDSLEERKGFCKAGHSLHTQSIQQHCKEHVIQSLWGYNSTGSIGIKEKKKKKSAREKENQLKNTRVITQRLHSIILVPTLISISYVMVFFFACTPQCFKSFRCKALPPASLDSWLPFYKEGLLSVIPKSYQPVIHFNKPQPEHNHRFDAGFIKIAHLGFYVFILWF